MHAFNDGKRPVYTMKNGLSQLVSHTSGIAEPAIRKKLGPGDKFWTKDKGVGYATSAAGKEKQATPRGPLAQAAESHIESRNTPRSGAQVLSEWVDREIRTQSVHGPVPLQDRVRIFNEAFSRAIEMLPEYRALFLSYQHETEALINTLQEHHHDFANIEGRMKTLKMNSLGFVGESTVAFQDTVRSLRQRLAECEKQRDELLAEKESMEDHNLELKQKSERDRWLSDESHKQNLDILSNLDRMEKQVEMLRKQEREMHAETAKLCQKVKDKELRVVTVEDQLNAERDKNANMVPKEEHEALKEELKAAKLRCQELEEKCANKEKDYQNIVDTYKRSIGQSTGGKAEARPLTPRPYWNHCRGIIDPDMLRSAEQTDIVQDILCKMMTSSRTLLAAYGLSTASQKSNVFQKFSRHNSTIPLASEASTQSDRQKTPQAGSDDPSSPTESQHRPTVTSKDPAGLISAAGGGGGSGGEDDKYLAADTDAMTPEPLRHSEPCKNHRFSRRRTAEFLDRVMQHRFQEGDSVLSMPFLEVMLSILEKEVDEEEAQVFAINIFASARRFAAEPDFLCYMLLMMGRISDSVVKDNRALCGEILRIFGTHFDAGDGSTRITKQKFFYGLREVLPHKEKEYCQDLVTYFPPGGPNVLINYEWLLQEDLYIISPIVYALRLQHLEEALNLSDRMEKAISKSLREGSTMVRYDSLEAVCKDDLQLALLQPEDFARGFQCPTEDLKPGSEQNFGSFLELMKNGGIFHELFFPALPDDDGEEGGVDDPEDGGGDMS
eukprot:TRINITY_DN48906_c0_g1_i1.p1 TRINITY_DN48906_c0_g1~~TRINITY_DN48906_c0_g1_i1.p1  ORF type:complete len:781 (-),score=206.94 TRINITY_DN48906_c0_g1_i1:37-2379(-)